MHLYHRLQPAKDRIDWIAIAGFAVGIILLSPLVSGGNQSAETDDNQADHQIQIVADKLITNNEEKYAQFSGNVRASQGNFVIVSESLRIYYRNGLDRSENRPGNQELIKRIVASGKVRITSDKYRAETNRVEYDLDTMILVLKGENSTVTSGKNVLTGSKITVYRRDGQIKVEGSPQKRVKAVFYTTEKAVNDLNREE